MENELNMAAEKPGSSGMTIAGTGAVPGSPSAYISPEEVRAILAPEKPLSRNGDGDGAAERPPTIALVDDDELFRDTISRNLSDAGFQVATLPDGASALRHLLGQGSADLIILDWKMPGLTGIEVLNRLRDAGVMTPVIFLTSLRDQIYEEAGLAGGAVDFVEKSRSFAILLKRIELVLARERGAEDGPAIAQAPEAESAQEDVVHVGALELRSDVSRAYWKGQLVELTLTEFKIVQYLASKAGNDVSYREIYDLARGKAGAGDEGYRANVRTFVKRIRQKFRDVDGSFEQIENYAGFGYQWRRERDDAS